MSRRLKPVAGGTRAPGCIVRGCGNQPKRGTRICATHARALQELPAGSVRRPPAEIPPAEFSHPDDAA
jgi:hypothetical protein